ncbi:MAG TPA: hypothetical protein EYG16_06225 [Deltaproteobacteria bacterium]|nr:hypothetical protein [Deltaproteobacteria bacterium]
MKTIDITDRSAFGRVIDELRVNAVVVQLAPVYVLIAAPTSQGVGHLDRLKIRLPNKTYSATIGDLSRFWQSLDHDRLPDGFHLPEAISDMSDVILRFPFAAPGFQSSTVRDGSHQALMLNGIHREMVKEIEAAFDHSAEPGMWAGKHFSAPLATSCNISGDPLGSIVDEQRALEFANSRGVGLLVTSEATKGECGSYPILELAHEGVSVRREGPGLSRLLRHVRHAITIDRYAAQVGAPWGKTAGPVIPPHFRPYIQRQNTCISHG